MKRGEKNKYIFNILHCTMYMMNEKKGERSRMSEKKKRVTECKFEETNSIFFIVFMAFDKV